MKNLLSGQLSTGLTGTLLPSLLLSISLTATAQTTYYVAANGSDANAGRSSDSPVQTLAKVSSLPLQPGDMILFRRGDTFRGTLYVRQSGTAGNPIVIDAYGSGDKPVIAGSTPVTNWSSVGNSTWQATCSTCGSEVTGVYRNNSVLPLGRYPNLTDTNKGYLTIQSHSGKTQLTSQQGLSTNWTGGEAVVRTAAWILDRSTIAGQSGNTLSLTNNSSNYEPSNGWGYFIQNHPATLDQTGEWYYNPADKTIRLYDSQNNPNGQLITVTTESQSVNLGSSSYITVRNIKITEARSTGLLSTGGNGITLSGNDITNAGNNGVFFDGSGSTILVENNLIDNINNNGFQIESYQNFTFRGNTIQRIGLVPGRGTNGDGTYSALLSSCKANSLIEYNVFDNLGYVGVSVTNSSTVRYNRISNFCLTKSDGGAIYTWNGNQNATTDLRFQSNVIYNGIGVSEGTANLGTTGAHGIYLDDCTTNAEVSNNSIFQVSGLGIFLHGARNSSITNNTSFANGEAQLKIVPTSVCLPRNITNQGNILVSRLATGLLAGYESNGNDLSSYGQFANNYYARPFEDQFKIQAVYNPGSGGTGPVLSLAEWQNRFSLDQNSANSPVVYKSQMVTQTGTTVLNYPYSGGADGWSAWSPYGNGRVDWDNTNKLDGGSMRLSFASASGKSDSYLLATVKLGNVRNGQTYQLLLDGIASGAGKRLTVYPRQQGGNYRDLADRTTFSLGTGRQTYEATFTANANESDAILVVQVYEDGQTAWIDNLTMREASLTTLNPDDYVKIVYNATGQATNVALDATYRDVKNTVYSGQISLPPYSSAVLLKQPPTAPTPTTTPAPTGTGVYLSDLNWTSVSNGFGPVEKDRSNGNDGAADGRTITLNGTTYAKGLGVHAHSSISYNLAGQYTQFITDMGLDDEMSSCGNVEFMIYLDGTKVYSSGNMGPSTATKSVTLDVSGKQTLTLVVSDGGDGISCDHGDWAGARLIPSGTTTTPTPTPTVSLREPENPNNTTAGLDYQYYEGSWSNLPDFNTLTPAKTGSATQPDPSVRSREQNYALRFTGYFNAPTDGTYTFYTTSDDGSKLLIGTTTVVTNDGQHGDQEQSGSIGLKAGKHAITVQYFQGGGGQTLIASYAGPNSSKQTIPTSAYFRVPATTTTTPSPTPTPTPSPTPTVSLREPENPNNTTTGLDYQYYEGNWSNLPDFNTLTPAKTGSATQPDPSVRGREQNYALRFTGYFNAPTDGTYTFYTTSDDGSKLLIGSTTVVTNDGQHGDQEQSGSIGLKAGKHAITVQYFQGGGGQTLIASYAGPNSSKQTIPASAYFRVPATTTTPTTTPAPTGTGVYLSDLNWTSVSNGFGPVEKDRSNGNDGAADGRTITLNGTTYAKGLGVHAHSSISYNLAGQYTQFITDMGLDDEMSSCGNVEFMIYLDGTKVYSSGNMGPSTATKSVTLDVSGKQTLTLVVSDGGDGISCDHGDWAGARLIPKSSGGRLAADAEPTADSFTADVYPNPAHDLIKVLYRAETMGSLSMTLLNEASQPVVQQVQSVTAGENQISLPVQNLNRGFYILSLVQGQQRITRKVILGE